MVQKRVFMAVFSTFLFILSIGITSANFACGEASIKDNSSILSPSWFNVKIYYSDNPNAVTYCKISPEDNKYCCNPREITNVSWAVGKIINAEITEYGYFADNVSTVITGGGYDVFPDLKIEKIINILEPNGSIYIDKDELNISIKTANKFNSISYKLFRDQNIITSTNLCNNCNSANWIINNLTFGNYILSVYTSSSKINYTENFSFVIIESANLVRQIQCDGCKGLRVPSSTGIVHFNLTLNTTNNVSGTFREIFPSNWIYQGDLQVYSFTESHNYIEKFVNGSNDGFYYSLIPPKSLFNYKFIFQSYLEGNIIDTSTISLSKFRFLDFLSFSKEFVQKPSKVYSLRSVIISPEYPLVLYPENFVISELIVFPNKEIQNTLVRISGSNYVQDNSDYSSFVISSNLADEDLKKVEITFSVDKNFVEDKNRISLQFRNSSIVNDIFIQLKNETENYFEYSATLNTFGGYVISKF